MPKRHEEFTETFDGRRLYVRSWAPDREPARAIVQIVHGMAEHGERYAHVADALSAAGYAVYVSDLRGHGKSSAGTHELGCFGEQGGWSAVIRDVHELGQRALGEHPGAPICLLGHSMGSFLAQAYLVAHPDALQGLVLSGTNAGGGALVNVGRLVARLERKRQGPLGRSALLEFLSFSAYNKGFESVRTEADWLSRDPEQVDRYIRDPECGYRSANQLWVELLDALHELGRAKLQRVPRDLPIYLFSGALDPVGLRTKGVMKQVRAYRKAGLLNVTYRFYPEARHECFNEINRDEVIGDLIAWLDTHVARPIELQESSAG